MKTLVLTFSDFGGFNSAVTCPQDQNLFVTFNKHEDLVEWLEAFTEPIGDEPICEDKSK